MSKVTDFIKSKRQIIDEYVEQLDVEQDIILLDGFDEAIDGIIDTNTGYRVVYDYHKVIEILMRDGMTQEMAHEYYDYNIASAYFNRNQPVFSIMKI